MSATHRRLGAGALNLRSTRSPGRSAVSSGQVVRRFLPRLTPEMPALRMTEATWSRPTSMPLRRAALWSLRAP